MRVLPCLVTLVCMTQVTQQSYAQVAKISGYIGSHQLTFSARKITDKAAYNINGKPSYIAITEIYPDTPDAVEYRYTVSAPGINTFERSHKALGFGPATYFIKVNKWPVGLVRITGVEKSSTHPICIGSVRGVSENELKALLDRDDFKVMGLVPGGSIAERDNYADLMMKNINTRPEYNISKGISTEIQYANADDQTLRTHIGKCKEWADKYNAFIFFGLNSWWSGTPMGVSDGQGGTFSDIKYQQICYSPDVEMPENADLKALLGDRYNRHYGQTIPNQWSNVPWLTMNSATLNQYRYRRIDDAVDMIGKLASKGSSWIHGFYLENEPRYWDDQMEQGNPHAGRQGKEVWADFNPAVTEAAKRDGVDLDPSDGLSQAERLWLHRNVGRYNQETVDNTRKSLNRRSSISKLPIYTHTLQYPSFLFPGGLLNHPSNEWAYAQGAFAGIEGLLTQPSIYERVRDWGRWANLNREENDGLPIEIHLWDMRVTYMMGSDLYNSYNWHAIGAQRFFDYVNKFTRELPVVSLPPAKTEVTGDRSIRISTPMDLQAFTRVEVPIMAAIAGKQRLHLDVSGTDAPVVLSACKTVDMKPGLQNVSFDFPTLVECDYKREAVITLNVIGDLVDTVHFTPESAAEVRLSLNLRTQRTLSLWAILQHKR